MTSNAHTQRSPFGTLAVPMFSLPVRGVWFALLAGTLLSELVPLSLEFEARFSAFEFHTYEAAKLVTFFLFGLLTPIAWWRYRSLGMGVLFAVATTAIVEGGQAFIPGHRASVLELAVKLGLLLAGFIAALDIRKYQELAAGPFRIRFTSSHWESAP